MDLMKPIINLNGTSRAELVETRIKARQACLDLIHKLGATAPNGRDYIGQPEAYKRDRDIYRQRFAFLDALYNTLGDEALAIQES